MLYRSSENINVKSELQSLGHSLPLGNSQADLFL